MEVESLVVQLIYSQSVTSSGDISGSGTGSFGVINVGGGIFTSASRTPVVVEYPLTQI